MKRSLFGVFVLQLTSGCVAASRDDGELIEADEKADINRMNLYVGNMLISVRQLFDPAERYWGIGGEQKDWRDGDEVGRFEVSPCLSFERGDDVGVEHCDRSWARTYTGTVKSSATVCEILWQAQPEDTSYSWQPDRTYALPLTTHHRISASWTAAYYAPVWAFPEREACSWSMSVLDLVNANAVRIRDGRWYVDLTCTYPYQGFCHCDANSES